MNIAPHPRRDEMNERASCLVWAALEQESAASVLTGEFDRFSARGSKVLDPMIVGDASTLSKTHKPKSGRLAAGSENGGRHELAQVDINDLVVGHELHDKRLYVLVHMNEESAPLDAQVASIRGDTRLQAVR